MTPKSLVRNNKLFLAIKNYNNISKKASCMEESTLSSLETYFLSLFIIPSVSSRLTQIKETSHGVVELLKKGYLV